MAHIGAMPGSPLYDEKGGMQKLIDGVAADIEKLQAGGVGGGLGSAPCHAQQGDQQIFDHSVIELHFELHFVTDQFKLISTNCHPAFPAAESKLLE